MQTFCKAVLADAGRSSGGNSVQKQAALHVGFL